MRIIRKKPRTLWFVAVGIVALMLIGVGCGSAPDVAPGPGAPAPAAPAPAAPAPAAPAPAIPAPAAPAPESPTRVSRTITVVLDNVGSPQFRNEKGTWPDVMFHGFFGFQEPLLGWEPTFDSEGNAIVDTEEACHAPFVATGWEWELPSKSGGTVSMDGKKLERLDEADLSDLASALEEVGGNRTRAAELLGMGRTTLWRKLKEYGLEDT